MSLLPVSVLKIPVLPDLWFQDMFRKDLTPGRRLAA